jgi:hypothetical protein
MPDGDLRQLAEVEEISIGFTRPDGSAGSTPVWVVQAGEAILVRSIRGRRGGWYRRLGANPYGEVGDGAHTHPVRARPVEDAGTVDAATGAYAAKDGDSPYVGSLLTEEAADATLRLEPRP